MKLYITLKRGDPFFFNKNLILTLYKLLLCTIISISSSLRKIRFENSRFFVVYLDKISLINLIFNLRSIEYSIRLVILISLITAAK